MSVRFRDMFCRLLIKSIIGVVAGCWMTALTYDVAIAQVLTSSPLPSVPSASATPVVKDFGLAVVLQRLNRICCFYSRLRSIRQSLWQRRV